MGKHNIAPDNDFLKSQNPPFRTLVKKGGVQPSRHLVLPDVANERCQRCLYPSTIQNIYSRTSESDQQRVLVQRRSAAAGKVVQQGKNDTAPPPGDWHPLPRSKTREKGRQRCSRERIAKTDRQIDTLQPRCSLRLFSLSPMCKSFSTSQGRWSKQVHQKAGQEPSWENPGDGERHTVVDDIHRRSIGPARYRETNRWLKSELAKDGFDRVMFGSADISLEDGYYQLHWHIAIWTSKPARLKKRLKQIFPSIEEYDRPVHLKRAYDLKFCRTKTKASNYPTSYAEIKKAFGKAHVGPRPY